MSTEEREPPRRRTRRQQSDEVRPTKHRGQRKEHAGEKTEIVTYEAETWEETKDGIRRLMRTIESRMSDLESKMKRLIKKYEECVRLKRLVDAQC